MRALARNSYILANTVIKGLSEIVTMFTLAATARPPYAYLDRFLYTTVHP